MTDQQQQDAVELEQEIVVEGSESERTRHEHATNNSTRFPAPFYDPTTGALMQEPVVDSAGNSHEKSEITTTTTTIITTMSSSCGSASAAAADSAAADSASSIYYPNRALQDIIQHEVALTSTTWQGSIRRLESAMQSGWGRLMEQSAFSNEQNVRPLPESFYCPITYEIMTDPVVSKEGITYERRAIQHWIRVNATSPATRNPLSEADLRPNHALYLLIQLEKGRDALSIHPSIRRWTESEVRTTRPDPNDDSDDNGDIDGGGNPALAIAAVYEYPTTQEQIQQRRRQRSQQNRTLFVVLCCTLTIMFLFFPYYFGLLLFMAMMSCPVILFFWLCCKFCNNDGAFRSQQSAS